jgi:hypothetical protein
MKGLQSLLVVFLLPGLLLFQMDQAVNIDWSVYEESFFTKSETKDPCINQNSWFDSDGRISFSAQTRIVFQLKNPFSFLFSSLQGTSPFWRPPPGLTP